MGLVPLTLYLLYIGGALLALFRRPIFGLFILVPLLPLQTIRYRLHEFPLGAQCIDVLLAATLVGLLIRGKPVFLSTPFTRLLAIYVGFTYLSLWFGAFFLGGDLPFFFNDVRLADWKNIMVMYLLFFLVTASIENRRDMITLMLVMVAATLLVDKNYYSGVSGRDTTAFSWERFAGVMGFAGANGVGAFQVQAFGLLISMWACAKKVFLKWGLLSLAMASLYCVVFAYSRGAYVAFLLVWIFLGIVKKPSLLIFFAVFLVAWESVVPPSVIERVTMTVSEDGQLESSSADRVNMWEDAIQVFSSSPLVGTGYHTYAFMGRHYKNAHNLYIQTLVETGVAGLILMLTIFVRFILYGMRMYKKLEDPLFASMGLGFAAWVVAVCGGNMFGVRIVYVEVYAFTFVLLGILVCAERFQDQRSEIDEEDEAEVLDSDFQHVAALPHG